MIFVLISIGYFLSGVIAAGILHGFNRSNKFEDPYSFSVHMAPVFGYFSLIFCNWFYNREINVKFNIKHIK